MSRLAVTLSPCGKCPFRKDVPIYLLPDRREEIADEILAGRDFPCHATVDWDDDDEEGPVPVLSGSMTCAGAVKAVDSAGGSMQLVRIAERLGMADVDRTLDSSVEVWDLEDWPRLAMGSTGDAPVWEVGDENGVETCGTVTEDCLAPAGFLMGSGGVQHGMVAADGECVECGDPLCSACADDEGCCGMCSATAD